MKPFHPVITSLMLFSCATGDAIIIKNKSGSDKNIIINYPTGFSFPANPDSLQAWDLTNTENLVSTKDIYRNNLKIPATPASSGKGWTFMLKARHEVTVLGKPTHRNTIKNTLVLSNYDTLKVDRSGNCWVYTIE